MRKNVLDSGMKKLFERILNKYISSMEKVDGNIYLIGWAKEETRKLINQEKIVKDLIEMWMDIE